MANEKETKEEAVDTSFEGKVYVLSRMIANSVLKLNGSSAVGSFMVLVIALLFLVLALQFKNKTYVSGLINLARRTRAKKINNPIKK